MTERFDLYRLSLLQKKQMHLEGEEFKNYTRKNWLKKVFSEEHTFKYQNDEIHYVPKFDNDNNDVVIGRIGRNIIREENKPPEEGFDEFEHQGWLAALLIIDPKPHKDGQKVAFQRVNEIGGTLPLMAGLAKSINDEYDYGPYSIEIGLLIEKQSFWDYVEKNKGEITFLSFLLITPNMFGSSDEITRDLREFQEKENAKRIKITLTNDAGEIKPKTKKIKQIVNYAERTGGIIQARSKKSKNYNSKDSGKLSYISGVTGTGNKLIKTVCEQLNKLFLRE